ncbi:MAG: hypothetical protein JSV86_10815 [Gemmatimonadota bacterium]|nr:MAG: hypothetical protein JSV86_10815 [Gemmatimonadota bacterium]
MRRVPKLEALALVAGLVVFGCTDSEGPLEPPVSAFLAPQLQMVDGEVVANLIAGQYIDAGDVRLWNDADYIYVELATAGDWCLMETHLHVSEVLGDIPQTKIGNPIPGRFDYAEAHDCATAYTYQVPLDWDVGTALVVAAHAELASPSATETAWARDADNLEFPGKNCATYIGFEVQELEIHVLLYYGHDGYGPGKFPHGGGDLYWLKSHYESMGAIVDYTDQWPDDLGLYKLVLLNSMGYPFPTPNSFFSADQKAALLAFVQSGRRLVVMTDHSGYFGMEPFNDLLSFLGVGIQINGDLALPDADFCAPLFDITPHQVTQGMTSIDASAVASLTLSGTAVSLARVDPAPYSCSTPAGDAVNGATWLAVDQVGDGDVVVLADQQVVDDFGYSDPGGDGWGGLQLANNLINY